MSHHPPSDRDPSTGHPMVESQPIGIATPRACSPLSVSDVDSDIDSPSWVLCERLAVSDVQDAKDYGLSVQRQNDFDIFLEKYIQGSLNTADDGQKKGTGDQVLGLQDSRGQNNESAVTTMTMMEISNSQQWVRFWQQFPRSCYPVIEEHNSISFRRVLAVNADNGNGNGNNGKGGSSEGDINGQFAGLQAPHRNGLANNQSDVDQASGDMACVAALFQSGDLRDSPTGDRPAHSYQNSGGYSDSVHGFGPATPTSDRHSFNLALETGDVDNSHNLPDLFSDLPEPKKRKFILVEDVVRRSRLRVRATLENVDTREIPDSFRKGFSVYPRSYFPREMQEPPPSATGAAFFPDDVEDDESDVEGSTEEEKRAFRAARVIRVMIKSRVTANSIAAASTEEREEGMMEISIPEMTVRRRSREVRLNDLGHRMAWLQSRVFAGRPVFLQRALDCYRAKTLSAMEVRPEEGGAVGELYFGRPGKRRWEACLRKIEQEEGGGEE